MPNDIILLTSAELPALSPDDQVLAREFVRQGWNTKIQVWNENFQSGETPVLVRSIWDYHLKIGAFKEWLQNFSGPLWNPRNLIAWNFSKHYLLELHTKDIPIVPSYFTADLTSDECRRKIQSWKVSDLVLKPAISASAYLTTKVRKKDFLHERFKPPGELVENDWMIQPFVESIATTGEISMIYLNDGVQSFLLHAIVKKPKAKDFRVQTEFGGNLSSYTPDSILEQFCEKVLAQIPGPWLYARVDVLKYENKWCLGELELIEPQLFFRFAPASAKKFIEVYKKRMEIP